MRRIRREELEKVAQSVGFTIGEAELDEFMTLAGPMMENLEAVEGAGDSGVPVPRAVRGEVRRPTVADDPLNAVIHWCSVKSTEDGPLAGKRIGLKDCIAVSGVPMTIGSRMLADYVPQQDAVVVERILAAGGEIVAKLNLDGFAVSGGAETSDYGAIRNPWDQERTAAGSSGGSAAGLYSDDIDITLGADQGGSIRLPSSWCGVLGLKPTFSLVPYTGISGLEPTCDHVGPMARNTEDLALLLSVVAGHSGDDPRQYDVEVDDYVGAVAGASDDLKGVRLAVVTESVAAEHEPDAPDGTKPTHAAFREAVQRLTDLGAEVTEVSIPEHVLGAPFMFVSLATGMVHNMHTGGVGFGHEGRYWGDFSTAFGKAMATMGDEMPPTAKIMMLTAAYARERSFGSLYGKAMAYRPTMRAAYDKALEPVDALVMPTTTHYAHKHLPDASLSEKVTRGWSMLRNTGGANVSGHPALSIPAAEADGLPVGLMLLGRRYRDADLLRIARTYERAYGWLPGAQA
jgi:amidase